MAPIPIERKKNEHSSCNYEGFRSHRCHRTENFSPEEAIDKTVLAKHIETFNNSFLVADKDGQLLGYLEGPVTQTRYVEDRSFTADVKDESHLPGGYITLTSLSISPSAQGLGVGKALLEANEESCLRRRTGRG